MTPAPPGRTGLRPAADHDRDVVLAWRNHPKVRAASLTTDVIAAADHAAWWERVLADPDRRLYVFERDGRGIGVVLYDLDGDVARWSHYLDVDTLDAENALLPAWLELGRAAVRHAFDTWPITRLDGETKAWNTPVIAMNRRFGADITHRTAVVDGEEIDLCLVSITADRRRV